MQAPRRAYELVFTTSGRGFSQAVIENYKMPTTLANRLKLTSVDKRRLRVI